jgi:hypothetical protein
MVSMLTGGNQQVIAQFADKVSRQIALELEKEFKEAKPKYEVCASPCGRIRSRGSRADIRGQGSMNGELAVRSD